MMWNRTRIYEALVARGLRSGSSATNPKVFLYTQSQDIAILYGPESRDFAYRPLGFHSDPGIRRKGGWRDDVFDAIRELIPPVDNRVRTRGWIEFDLPPEGWQRLAVAIGLEANLASEEFEKLPPAVRAGFSPEPDKPGHAVRTAAITEVCHNHGVVVNHLAALIEQSGQFIGNDQRQDLILLENGKVKALFEAKSDCSLQSVYTAIGQLMYHGSVGEVPPIRIAVLPHSVSREVVEGLRKLNILLVTFRLVNGVPQFSGLEEALHKVETK